MDLSSMTTTDALKLVEAVQGSRLAVVWLLVNFEAVRGHAPTNNLPARPRQHDGQAEAPKNPASRIDE